jgi:uroporphyrinogen decarboxylase
MLPWALGQGLHFAEGEGPVLPPIRDAAGVAALDPARVEGAVAPILETVRLVRAGLERDHPATTLIGFAGSPFTVVCYMVEGGGSKEFAHVRGMAWSDPALFARLIDIVTEASITYLAGQIEAGAEAVMRFDSWAGVLPPSLFRAYVAAPSARIVAALGARFPSIPVIGFPRLAGMLLGEYARTTGVRAVGMDTAADPALAARLVPEGVALQGNLDPLALVAGGAALAAETRAILDTLRGRPFIFNLGHGIVPQTSPEHVASLVAQLRAA